MKNCFLLCFMFPGFMFHHDAHAQTRVKQIDSTLSINNKYISYEIVFEFDKPVLKPESYIFLDSMVAYLMQHDSLIMQVKNHTDVRGSDIYATKLSARRAQAIVDYMVKKGGILPRRLIPTGFEHHEPVYSTTDIEKMKTSEEQEEAHKKNRRTEFVIVSTHFKKDE